MSTLIKKRGIKIYRLTQALLPAVLLAFILLAVAGLFCAAGVEASGTQTLWNLEIGDKVVDPTWQWEFKTGNNYSGTGVTKPVTWIVVAKDHYGAGSGVTLLSEGGIGKFAFDNSTDRGHLSYGHNHWGESGTTDATRGLRPWLNSTGIHAGTGFYNAFTESFKSSINTTTLTNKEGIAGTPYDTVDMVFIPSATELGDDPPTGTYEIGTVYPYFDELKGIGIQYWTRSPNMGDNIHLRCVNTTGSFDLWYWSINDGIDVRPALNLQSDTLVSAIPNDDGAYEIGPPPTTGPTLRFPLHGANVPYDKIRLVWFKDAVATKYQYQVFDLDWSLHASGTLGDLDNVLVSGFPGDGSLYRWRVRAGNASGWGPFSSLRAFFSLNAPPAQVVQHSPAHGATVPGSDIEFKWIKAHYATKYQYQVFRADWTVHEAGTLGNLDSVTVSGFLGDGSVYRWRVRAGNPYGWGAWSALRVLTNEEVSLPPQVLLHSPAHGATVPGSSLQLQWHSAAGATNYQYQVFNPDWSVHASGTLGNVNSVTVSGLPNDGTLYRWRVRAGNAAGWGQFSSLRAFWNGAGSYEESE